MRGSTFVHYCMQRKARCYRARCTKNGENRLGRRCVVPFLATLLLAARCVRLCRLMTMRQGAQGGEYKGPVRWAEGPPAMSLLFPLVDAFHYKVMYCPTPSLCAAQTGHKELLVYASRIFQCINRLPVQNLSNQRVRLLHIFVLQEQDMKSTGKAFFDLNSSVPQSRIIGSYPLGLPHLSSVRLASTVRTDCDTQETVSRIFLTYRKYTLQFYIPVTTSEDFSK